MLKHNLLLFFRNIRTHRGVFFINLAGLTSGLCSVIFIFLWIHDEYSYDRFYSQQDRIYRVMEHTTNSSGVFTSIESCGPLAPVMAQEIPEIAYTAAIAPSSWFSKFTLSVGDKNLKVKGQYAGKDFFNIFPDLLQQGDRIIALERRESIVLTERLAENLFGSTSGIIGKTVRFQHEKDFIVTGIAKDLPSNSSQQFDFVLPFSEMEAVSPWVKEWNSFGPHIYVLLKPGVDVEALNKRIAGFSASKSDNDSRTLFLRPFAEYYLYGKYEDGKQVGGRIEYIRLFSLVAAFVLLIACINFMNLSTAKSTIRAKEVGIRKTLGTSRKYLVWQYLQESILLSLLALICAVVIVWALLPAFNRLTDKNLVLIPDWRIVVVLVSIVIVTGLLAGSYPAFYLSRFKPVAIFKGNLKTSIRELIARKGLVVFQFAVSIILIIAVIVLHRQINFIQQSSAGYNKENVVYFEREGKVAENIDLFLTELRKVPGVINASSTAHDMVEHNFSTSGINWPGMPPDNDVYFQGVEVNYDLLETLSIPVIAGRSFSRDFGADSTKIIFNEAAIALMNLKEPLGTKINMWGRDREIVGVVKDFHFESFHEKIKPTFFILVPPRFTKYVMARLQAGKQKEALAGLETLYANFNPGFSLDLKFLDKEYQVLYASEKRVAVLSRYFAALAMIISCLGLFGLTAFMADTRKKEIGVRKVLGASLTRIAVMISRDFVVLVGIAICIALPVAVMLTDRWLDSFAYKAPMHWWFFALGAVGALMIAVITVSFQSIKAASANPVKALRSE